MATFDADKSTAVSAINEYLLTNYAIIKEGKNVGCAYD